MENWRAEVKYQLFLHRFKQKDLAPYLNWNEKYLCSVISGARNPKNAEEKITCALDQMIKEKG